MLPLTASSVVKDFLFSAHDKVLLSCVTKDRCTKNVFAMCCCTAECYNSLLSQKHGTTFLDVLIRLKVCFEWSVQSAYE